MKRLIGPFLLSFTLFVILIALGVWQVVRLQWKEGLLAEIATAQANPPIPLGAAPRQFTKVFVTGRWDAGHAVLYGTDVRNDRLGAFLIEPLLRDGAPPLWVDRGFVPDGAGLPRDAGVATVTGYIREPDHAHWWGVKDDLRERHFYTLNPAAIASELGTAAPAPYTLVAMGGNPGAFPEAAQAFPDLSNNHLSYAITWFSLALVDLVIFAISSRGRRA